MDKRRSNEKGQVIVVLALAMIVLLLFAALAIDGGNMYTNRRIAQNAADAGALAGAQKLVQLCKPDAAQQRLTQLRDVVQQFVTLNAGTLRTSGGGEGAPYGVYFIDSQGNRLYGG